MIKEFPKILEDPKQPLLGPNLWLIKWIGILLPENRFGRAAYIFLHELATFFVISQYIEIILIRSNQAQVLENMKISMLSIVCVVKSNTCILWQANWRKLLDYVAEADNYEREDHDEVRGQIIKKYTLYCRWVTYFYWMLTFTTFVTVTTAPLLKFLSSPDFRKEFKEQNGTEQNGTEPFPHIFSSWMPFNKYQSPGTWITVIWHACICLYGATICAAFDSCAIAIMTFLGGKLDLLQERAKIMLGSSGNAVSDEEALKKVHQLHQVYVLLTKYSRLFNSMLSPVMFLYVVGCSLMLCASAFQLLSAASITQRLLLAEYLVFLIAQLFMFCWHSNVVKEKSTNVIFGPYGSEWWAANVKQRKYILLLCGHFRINHVFTAGPFTDLTIATFVTILKGAYSYYTLLRK